jgi:enoyl-[acyl-carrier protein] reductase II
MGSWGAWLCWILGISIPVIQGGMACVSTVKLAAAVSNAGGAGIIGAGRMKPEQLRAEIRRCKELTDKPFGVNFMLLSKLAPQIIEVILDEGVAFVTCGAGRINRETLERFHEKGIKVLPLVASARMAAAYVRMGVDAIIVEGQEAGGHIGRDELMPLLDSVLEAVKGKVPVIAAGGIYDATSAAVYAKRGVEGVQCGTAFMVAEECEIADSVKQMIIEAEGDCTTVTYTPHDRHPVRIIANELSRQVSDLDAGGYEDEKAELCDGALERAMAGDIEMGSVMAGKIACYITAIEPAAVIVHRIYDGVDELSKVA